MAALAYFADLPTGETIVLGADDGKRIRYDGGSTKRATSFSGRYEGAWIKATRRVERKSFPSRHECDARCVNATGLIMRCECSCGGKNHGKGSFQCEAA